MFGQVACRVLAADQLSWAGTAAGSTITRAPVVLHTRPPTRGPHDGPHNRRLAWVAADGTGGSRWHGWHRCQQRRWLTLEGHTGEILGAAFAPDGRTLYTDGLDSSVIKWD